MKVDKQLIYDGIDFGLEKMDDSIPGSYIIFLRRESQEVGKCTRVWFVAEPNSTKLGEVRWFGRWRKYGFFTEAGKVFEETCMREIAYFCETATKKHKKGANHVAAPQGQV